MPLSDDAKKELRDAIRIVREDRFEKFIRQHPAFKGGTPPNTDDPKDPPTNPNDPPKEPNQEPPKPKAGGYWGELLSED